MENNINYNSHSNRLINNINNIDNDVANSTVKLKPKKYLSDMVIDENNQ